MSELFDTLYRVAEHSVAGGYVVALALICLLQYMVHVFRVNESKRVVTRYRDEVHGLESELGSERRDRLLTQLENEVLREFVSETELQRALDLVLRRLVVSPRKDFGALLLRERNGLELVRSRGLSQESADRLEVDEEFQQQAEERGVSVIEGRALFDSSLTGSLSREDRAKVAEAYLVAFGNAEDVGGFLLTTALYPPGSPRDQQLEVAQRLMKIVGTNVRQARLLESREEELRYTEEMLELRSIVDCRFETPTALVESFVSKLTEAVGAERGTVYLSTRELDQQDRVLVRCGLPLPNNLLEQWHRHEDRLSHTGPLREIWSLDAEALSALGIDTLLGSAMVAPLTWKGTSVGVVVLSRKDRTEFRESRRRLVKWSVEFLSEAIQRASEQAIAERHAREDPLTGLANRRTFDGRIASELARATNTDRMVTLLLADLDRFKQVNDTYGHQAGDEVLRVVADVFRCEVERLTRPADESLVARYGGEEIAVLLPGVDESEGRQVAESIRSAIEGTVPEHDGRPLPMTASIGLASFPVHATTVEGLVAAADAALYQAKQSGRNRIVTAAPSNQTGSPAGSY